MCFHNLNEFFWIPNKVYISQSCNIHLLIVLQTRKKREKSALEQNSWKYTKNCSKTVIHLCIYKDPKKNKAFESPPASQMNLIDNLPPHDSLQLQSPHEHCVGYFGFSAALALGLLPCSTQRLSLSVGCSFSKNYVCNFCFQKKKKDQKKQKNKTQTKPPLTLLGLWITHRQCSQEATCIFSPSIPFSIAGSSIIQLLNISL